MFTTQFKVLVGAIVIFILFFALAINQLRLSKRVEQSMQMSQSAASISKDTLTIVDKLVATPTASPTPTLKVTPKVVLPTRILKK